VKVKGGVMASFCNTAIKMVGNSKFLLLRHELASDKDFPFSEKDENLIIENMGYYLIVRKHGRKN